MEQVVKVLGKLDERKYPEYNLGNTRMAKLNILFWLYLWSIINVSISNVCKIISTYNGDGNRQKGASIFFS